MVCVNKLEAVQFTETGLNKDDSLWEDFPGFHAAALLQDTAPLNKCDQLYKLSLIACMFEAEPRHLLAHVTTLTPLLICNCPRPLRNTTLGSGREEGLRMRSVFPNCIPACTVEAHVCVIPHGADSRSSVLGCNNLILVGQPERWMQHAAHNGLSLLVSLAKGLCPSLFAPPTKPGWCMRGAPGGQLCLHTQAQGGCLYTSASALTQELHLLHF